MVFCMIGWGMNAEKNILGTDSTFLVAHGVLHDWLGNRFTADC